MALAGGVDLVIELPYIYSTALAGEFARGAITLLDAIKCSSFAFGSEQGTIKPFLNTFLLIESNRQQYNKSIQQAMKTGVSYPQALYQAYEELTKVYPDNYIDLSQPNNILGFHYIEAAHSLKALYSPLRFSASKLAITRMQTILNTSPVLPAFGKPCLRGRKLNNFFLKLLICCFMNG